MPQIKSPHPSSLLNFRLKHEMRGKLVRLAQLLGQLNKPNTYSDRQAGQILMERYADQFERDLLEELSAQQVTPRLKK